MATLNYDLDKSDKEHFMPKGNRDMSEKIPVINVDGASPVSGVVDPKAAKQKHSANSHNIFSNDVYKGKIYTRRVKGFFQSFRRYSSTALLLLFLAIPWFNIDNRPAVLFDLGAQKFHIFWMTFWPQDGVFLMWLLVLAAFLLFTVTIVIGRAWCGFTCPQTVWTFMFMWVEDKCEGDRNQRIKLDAKPWGLQKLGRKGSKHGLWLMISLVTAITFVGYFYEIKPLVVDLYQMDAHYLGYSWILFFTLGTYLNAGWLREKVCQHMCPYSRFQSVMYDKNTLVVSYDSARGESRGKRKNMQKEQNAALGDCIDCSWCVQVCPVDIDIRDGLQFECIDCGLCADACDSVMKKVGYAPGLIRFTSESALQGGNAKKITPRLIGYATASVIVVAAFFVSLAMREAITVDVVRDRSGQLYRQVGEQIENVYSVKVNNKAAQREHFTLSLNANLPYQLLGETKIYVKAGEVDTLRVSVLVPLEAIETGHTPIDFVVSGEDAAAPIASQASTFIAPVSN